MDEKPSSSPRIRALEYRYKHCGGMRARYMALYAEGKSNTEIACEFGINPNTLRTYWVRKWNKRGI